MRHRKTTYLGILFAAVALLGLSACQGTDDSTEPPTSKGAELVNAQTCSDIRQKVVDATTERILQRRYGGYYGGPVAAGAEGDASRGNNDSAGSQSPSDYTETNTQEEGVDETDIVKTDGDYIYTVHNNKLLVLQSWPADQTSIVGEYEIGANLQSNVDGDTVTNRNIYAQSLFLKGDKVAVFSRVYEHYQNSSRSSFNGTRITILDVTDRTTPSLLQQVDFEGRMISGRMVDGNVYLVSRSQLNAPVDVWEIVSSDNLGLPEHRYIEDEWERRRVVNSARPQVESIVRNRLRNETVNEMLPRRRLFNDQGQLVWSEPAYDCNELYLTQQTSKLGVLNVSHFDFDEPQKVTSTGVLAEGWTVYASTENLYIAQSSRSWFWWGWWGRTRDAESHVHKFKFGQNNKRPVYVASGAVEGNVLDQFSLDEHNGYLRVASTVPAQWGSDGTQTRHSSNRVTVLEQDGNLLKSTGKVTGLAPGESIQSVRMMGDKGYVVTFEQIDPLFTLDLSDPTAPTVKGELKITGFSSYIHPLGEDHLMTIGRAGNQQGLTGEVQLQIFDVSDMTNPTLKHSEKISTGQWSSWSEAMWNHHAFTYHPGRDMLAFPVNIYEWSAMNGQNFSGLLVYRADAQSGFQRVGHVDHKSLGSHNPDYYSHWWTSVRRSIFIEDYVYSLSERGMKVNGLTNPTNEYAAVPFK
jgi:uncharacterized secreted protein with C-terminal beta-propeller domain